MWQRWRANLKERQHVLSVGVRAAVLVLGSGLALKFGKLFVAAGFGLLAMGVARRYFRLKGGASRTSLTSWRLFAQAFVAIAAAGLIAEVIHLPVGDDQAGFDKSILLIVGALVLLFYLLAGAVLRRVLAYRKMQSVI
jgi:hypothetical protein